MTKDFKLNKRAKKWIDGFRNRFIGRSLTPHVGNTSFKIL